MEQAAGSQLLPTAPATVTRRRGRGRGRRTAQHLSTAKNNNHLLVLEGVVEGHAPEPVAWTFLRTDGGKSFYTSLGHVDDFRGPVLPRLLLNAIEWCLHD